MRPPPRAVRRVVGALEAAQVRRYGRSMVSLAARTPVLLLHTAGRRSGTERATTLAYHRDPDGSLLVVGGAGGQRCLPDWVANLRADPRAEVTLDRNRFEVTVAELGGEERRRVWQQLSAIWPRIEVYERRAGRPVPVIRVTPVRSQLPVSSMFGDRVVPVSDARVATRVVSGFDWQLLNLAGFERYLRVDHGGPGADSPWDAPADVVATIAKVAARQTSTPSSTYFAIWDGYGWPGSSGGWHVRPCRNPLSRAGGAIRDRFQRRVDHRRQDRARRALDAELSSIPKLELPTRSYYLLTGPVAAASEIATPGSAWQLQMPDLWWPEDLAWLVATDVDLDHTVVGGSQQLVDELAAALPDRSRAVDRD